MPYASFQGVSESLQEPWIHMNMSVFIIGQHLFPFIYTMEEEEKRISTLDSGNPSMSFPTSDEVEEHFPVPMQTGINRTKVFLFLKEASLTAMHISMTHQHCKAVQHQAFNHFFELCFQLLPHWYKFHHKYREEISVVCVTCQLF